MAHESRKLVRMLTTQDVEQIRNEPRKGPGGRGGTGNGSTLLQLAQKYNTSYRNIRAILDGETHHGT